MVFKLFGKPINAHLIWAKLPIFLYSVVRNQKNWTELNFAIGKDIYVKKKKEI